ncbi:hypothetical protein [Streptomyces abikoensis]
MRITGGLTRTVKLPAAPAPALAALIPIAYPGAYLVARGFA